MPCFEEQYKHATIYLIVTFEINKKTVISHLYIEKTYSPQDPLYFPNRSTFLLCLVHIPLSSHYMEVNRDPDLFVDLKLPNLNRNLNYLEIGDQ